MVRNNIGLLFTAAFLCIAQDNRLDWVKQLKNRPYIDAREMSGADIGAKVNAAFSSCPGGAAQSCKVVLPHNQVYSFSTTITIPDRYVEIDCQGSELDYAGSGDAIYLAPSPSNAGGNRYITAKIRNCFLKGNANANAVGVHQESRIGVVLEDMRIWDFTGANGAGIWYENKAEAVGLPQFNEQNTLRKVDVGNNTRGIKVTVNGGTNSFAYNVWDDVHFDVRDGQYGVLFQGTGVTQTLFVNGGRYNLKFNLTTNAVAGRAVCLLSGADWERASVAINGEKTAGAAASYGLWVDATSIFANTGVFQIDGVTNNFIAGSKALLYPSGFPNSLAPTATYTLDETGLARFQQDVRFGSATDVHLKTGRANADISFVLLINAGFTNATYNFQHAYNNVPNCVVAPNTLIQCVATNPQPMGWWVTPFVNAVNIGMPCAQGNPVTFFVICLGNPD